MRDGIMSHDTLGKTSRTIVDILRGPPCPERDAHVEDLIRIYQPVWNKVALAILSRYAGSNPTLDAQDVVGDEIAEMLDPHKEYFGTFKPEGGKLRNWMKTRIANAARDLMRRRRPLSDDGMEDREAPINVMPLINDYEMNELFREALRIADRYCLNNGMETQMEIFRAMRCESGRLGEPERRKKGWTEWKERDAVRRVMDIIRDEAIPAASRIVTANPEDATELAQALWDKVRRGKKRVDVT